MLRLIIFIGISCILASTFQKNAVFVEPKIGERNGWKSVNSTADIAFLILLIYWILFAGTRNGYNDTYAYINGFLYKTETGFSALSNINWSIGENPGFWIYQIFIKSIFGANQFRFLTITASIIYISFLKFYRGYSSDFSYTIYICITSLTFFFTLGATKQVFSMAIGIWALPLALERKWIRFGLCLFIAMLFHPYIILFVCIPFLKDKVWNARSFLILFITIILGYTFQSMMGVVLEMTSSIGDDYSSVIVDEGSVNIARFFVYCVPPVLSFFVRKEINYENNSIYIACVNLSFISAVFMFLALFGGANLFGRVANYFLPFSMVALPYIISKFPFGTSKLLKSGSIICYGLFWAYYYRGIPMFSDMLSHVSILRLFS